MFNVDRHNGINLNRSVNNPHSNTARIVRYILAEGRQVTKRDIMREVFNRVPQPSKWGGVNYRVGSWGSNLFAGLVQANILVKERKYNSVYYRLGANASVVKL